MKKVCWIVPVHPPHFEVYARHLEKAEILAQGIDHIAVFTSLAEAESFSKLRLAVAPQQIIVLEDFFPPDLLRLFLRTKSIINVKKLFAVQRLQDEYSHLIVTDSEIELFSTVTKADVFRQDTFFPFHRVHKAHLLHKVAAPAAMISADEDRGWIMRNFVDPGLYSWFSNVPIYESRRLAGFWDRFSLREKKDFLRLTYDSFDFILYQYHVALASRGSREITWEEVHPNFDSSVGSCWELGYTTEWGRKFLGEDGSRRRPLWVSHASLREIVPSAKMLFHTDRVVDESKLTTREKILKIIVLVSRRFLGLSGRNAKTQSVKTIQKRFVARKRLVQES